MSGFPDRRRHRTPNSGRPLGHLPYTPVMTVADRLEALGIELPPVTPPAGNYVSCVIDGDLVYAGGHGPFGGREDRPRQGRRRPHPRDGTPGGSDDRPFYPCDSARGVGGLDRIERFVKVFGMVNVAPAFDRTPAVIDGCSNLLVEMFGDAAATPAPRRHGGASLRHRRRDRAGRPPSPLTNASMPA